MTVFILIAVALAVLALGFVLRPVWRAAPLPGLVACAGLMVATALLYQLVGNPLALDPAQRRAPTTLAEAITRMQATLERHPEQAQGWQLLARAYVAEGRLSDASAALARAAALLPDNPDVLVEAARASAQADPQHRFDDAAVAQLQRALQLQPRHQRARWLLGIAQRQRGDAGAAANTWEPLLAIVDADTLASLRPQIDAARADAGLPPLPPPDRTPAATGIEVVVSLAPQLAQRLPVDASLFVIAQQPGGPPMPVAVEKLPARDFPIRVILDDNDSPMPTRSLSQVATVTLTARVSASGNAMARPGDLESTPIEVDVATSGQTTVTIDHVVQSRG